MNGSELRELRRGWQLSQAEFGRLFGYSEETISALERGKKRVTKSLELHILSEVKLRKIKEIVDSS